MNDPTNGSTNDPAPSPAPTPPTPPPMFSPGVGAWIFAIFCGLGAGALMGLGQDAHRYVSALFGAVIATLLFSTLIGWLFWRLGGRKARGGRTAFVVVAMFSLFGQVTTLMDRVEAFEALRAVREPQHAFLLALRDILGNTRFAQSDVGPSLARLNGVFETAAARVHANPTASRVMEAYREQFGEVAEAELTYFVATNEFVRANVAQLADIERDGEIARLRLVCKRLIDAGGVYREFLGHALPRFEERLAQAQVPRQLRREILDAARADQARRKTLEEMIGQRDRFASALMEVLNLLDETQGHWRDDAADKIIFERDEDLQAFQAAAAKTEAARKRLEELEVQVRKAADALLAEPGSRDAKPKAADEQRAL